jgi:hypothetical protein
MSASRLLSWAKTAAVRWWRQWVKITVDDVIARALQRFKLLFGLNRIVGTVLLPLEMQVMIAKLMHAIPCHWEHNTRNFALLRP